MDRQMNEWSDDSRTDLGQFIPIPFHCGNKTTTFSSVEGLTSLLHIQQTEKIQNYNFSTYCTIQVKLKQDVVWLNHASTLLQTNTQLGKKKSNWENILVSVKLI